MNPTKKFAADNKIWSKTELLNNCSTRLDVPAWAWGR
jgi:hypothetical protein